MIYKIIGITVIFCALILSATILHKEGLFDSLSNINNSNSSICSQKTPSEQLRELIENDFEMLLNKSELPTQWNSISTVNLIRNSKFANIILGNNAPRFPKTEDGHFALEVEMIDLNVDSPEDENPGLIIQASLFDLKSKNKIYEIGRTYTMNDLNRLPKDMEAPKVNPKASAISSKEEKKSIK